MKTPENTILREGLKVLRNILKRMRDDNQDGYCNVKNGKFAGAASFVTSGLPQATPEEIDALFALAGIVPDAIKPNGSCSTCVFGDEHGGDLGWSNPCCSCARPKMTNFVPVAAITKKQLEINDTEAQFLTNIKNGVWWGTGIAQVGNSDSIQACRRMEKAMIKRDMMKDTLRGRRITQKGLRALSLRQKKEDAA